MLATHFVKRRILQNIYTYLGVTFPYCSTGSQRFIIPNEVFGPSCKFFSSKISDDFRSVFEKYPRKARKVETLFRKYGFTDAHISTIARLWPQSFSYNPEKIISPKLDFLKSIGVAGADIPKVVTRDTSLLGRNLEKQIIPCYNFLKCLATSKVDLVSVLVRNPRIFGINVENCAINIEALRQVGVPSSFMLPCASRFPSSVQRDPKKFKECLDEAMRMGFNPSRITFVIAVNVLCGYKKSTLDSKLEVFRKFGLTNDQAMVALRSHPGCLMLSEEKLTRGMHFFVEEMRLEPETVVRNSSVLFYDLEKRITPRCRVITHLKQKGLLKDKYSLASFLKCTNEDFLDKFVYKHGDLAPELMRIYRQGTVL